MNRFEAVVTKIEAVDRLHRVSFSYKEYTFVMVSLELPKIALHSKVLLGIKPTHVVVAKELHGITSFENCLKVNIEHIKKGALLSVITCFNPSITLQSFITSASLERMRLEKEQEVSLLFQASDLFIERLL